MASKDEPQLEAFALTHLARSPACTLTPRKVIVTAFPTVAIVKVGAVIVLGGGSGGGVGGSGEGGEQGGGDGRGGGFGGGGE